MKGKIIEYVTTFPMGYWSWCMIGAIIFIKLLFVMGGPNFTNKNFFFFTGVMILSLLIISVCWINFLKRRTKK